MTALPRLVRLHARTLCRVADLRESAARARMVGDTDRAEIAEDEAAAVLADANALRDILAERDDVLIPDPNQLSLLADGGA
jgi:hypothetical protein